MCSLPYRCFQWLTPDLRKGAEYLAHCIENNLNLFNEILLKTSFDALQVFNVFKASAIIIFS